MTILKILGAVLLLALVLVTVVSLRSNAAALRPGATAPDIKAKAAVAGHVRDFDLKDQIGQHAVVLYFFPKAFTKG